MRFQELKHSEFKMFKTIQLSLFRQVVKATDASITKSFFLYLEGTVRTVFVQE